MQKKPPALPLPAGLEVQPLRPERWADVETLFGAHGAYGGGWRFRIDSPASLGL